MSKIGITDRFALIMVVLFYLTTVAIGVFYHPRSVKSELISKVEQKMLNHIVLIKFKSDITATDLQLISDGGVRGARSGHPLAPLDPLPLVF